MSRGTLRGRTAASIFALGALSAASVACAQSGPAATEIHLAEIRFRGDTLTVGAVRNITERPGYDNQPSFSPDGSQVLYTAYLDGQADIYRYEIESGRTVRVTETPESEYSPQVTPDGSAITVVRVEADSVQRIWSFPIDEGEPTVVMEKLAGVGYYAWGDENTIAAFVIGEPHSLFIGDVPSGRFASLLDGIGRSMSKVPGNEAISYTRQAPAGDGWIIEAMDLRTGGNRPLARGLQDSEDFCWTPRGVLLMARGSKLYQWNDTVARRWVEVYDFAGDGLAGITRLAVSPQGDRLAFVAAE